MLDNPESIRAFATAYRQQKRPLHVLINNAGANYMSEDCTADGIPLLTQVIISAGLSHCRPCRLNVDQAEWHWHASLATIPC